MAVVIVASSEQVTEDEAQGVAADTDGATKISGFTPMHPSSLAFGGTFATSKAPELGSTRAPIAHLQRI
jgi:hypothetical protein